LDVPSDQFQQETDETRGRDKSLFNNSVNGSDGFDPFQVPNNPFGSPSSKEKQPQQKSLTQQFDISGFDGDPFNNGSFPSLGSNDDNIKKSSPKKANGTTKKKKKADGNKKKSSAGAFDGNSSIDRKGKQRNNDKSARKTRTIPLDDNNTNNDDGNFGGAGGRREYRNGLDRSRHTDLDTKPKKSSSAGKTTKKTTKTKRTKSEPINDGFGGSGTGFDFETPPVFGSNSNTPTSARPKFGGGSGVDNTDFFDVAESAWGNGGFMNAPPIAPSRKERRGGGGGGASAGARGKSVELDHGVFEEVVVVDNNDDDDDEEEEEDDFFDDQKFMTRTPTGGGAQNRRTAATAINTTNTKTSFGVGGGGGNAMSNGWMAEMPGHMRHQAPPPEDDDDSDGFELEVNGADPVSPLTVATRKVVRPVISRRRG
jgi:hypothetical protein